MAAGETSRKEWIELARTVRHSLKADDRNLILRHLQTLAFDAAKRAELVLEGAAVNA